MVIENQLEPTDHDHLGKVVTYLTNLEAKTAIWVARDPRPEHIRAISWLNESTPMDVGFYLVKLSAYRIGESDPAPLFTLIVGPTSETKDIGEQKKDLAERHRLRLEFWKQLLDCAKSEGLHLHANRTPSKDNWLDAGAGKSGLVFRYVIWMEERSGVELYIDTGDKEQNESIFDCLFSKKQSVEQEFGEPLAWERLDNKRACRLQAVIYKGGLRDTDAWAAIQNGMVEKMARFSQTLKPLIKTL